MLALVVGCSSTASPEPSASASQAISADAMKRSAPDTTSTSQITWINNLDTDVTFKVFSVDTNDWYDKRPDLPPPNGIQGLVLKTGQSHVETLDAFKYASGNPFNTTITNAAGDIGTYRWDRGEGWHFSEGHYWVPRDFTYKTSEGAKGGQIAHVTDGEGMTAITLSAKP